MLRTNGNQKFFLQNSFWLSLIGSLFLIFLVNTQAKASGLQALSCQEPDWGQAILLGDPDSGFFTEANLLAPEVNQSGNYQDLLNLNRVSFINLGDVITMLENLYLGKKFEPNQVFDANDDGVFNIDDVRSVLSYLFLSGPPPALKIKITGEAQGISLYTPKNEVFLKTEFQGTKEVNGVMRGVFDMSITDKVVISDEGSCPEGYGVLGFHIGIYGDETTADNIDLHYQHAASSEQACVPSHLRFSLQPNETAVFLPTKFICYNHPTYKILNGEPLLFNYSNGVGYVKRSNQPWKEIASLTAKVRGSWWESVAWAQSFPMPETQEQLDQMIQDIQDQFGDGDMPSNVGPETEPPTDCEEAAVPECPPEGDSEPPPEEDHSDLCDCIPFSLYEAVSGGFNLDPGRVWTAMCTAPAIDKWDTGPGVQVGEIFARPFYPVHGAACFVTGVAGSIGGGFWWCCKKLVGAE